ncbi:hypothetical protein BKA62DRAFT_837362 [Auriculariales sp. MPI-PUGE-AT-0066]|nr:hypothetical protein BKA62DRAFT_837362 [Auriculariales sp. MPI-PUGE-AT-0066]
MVSSPDAMPSSRALRSVAQTLNHADGSERVAATSLGVAARATYECVEPATARAWGDGQQTVKREDGGVYGGDGLWLHLFIDALALQSCTPTFITARDAWIQTDKNRYKGANRRTLWTVFASRGIGQGTTSARKDNADVPAKCSGSGTCQPPCSDDDQRLTYLNLLRRRRMNLRRLKLPTPPTRRIPPTRRSPPNCKTRRTSPSAPTGGASSNE